MMKSGILWFDNSSDELDVKIRKGFEYYVKKYGIKPNLCLINPSMLHEDMRITASFFMKVSETDLLVKPYIPVLHGKIWIGIGDEDEF